MKSVDLSEPECLYRALHLLHLFGDNNFLDDHFGNVLVRALGVESDDRLVKALVRVQCEIRSLGNNHSLFDRVDLNRCGSCAPGVFGSREGVRHCLSECVTAANRDPKSRGAGHDLATGEVVSRGPAVYDNAYLAIMRANPNTAHVSRLHAYAPGPLTYGEAGKVNDKPRGFSEREGFDSNNGSVRFQPDEHAGIGGRRRYARQLRCSRRRFDNHDGRLLDTQRKHDLIRVGIISDCLPGLGYGRVVDGLAFPVLRHIDIPQGCNSRDDANFETTQDRFDLSPPGIRHHNLDSRQRSFTRFLEGRDRHQVHNAIIDSDLLVFISYRAHQALGVRLPDTDEVNNDKGFIPRRRDREGRINQSRKPDDTVVPVSRH